MVFEEPEAPPPSYDILTDRIDELETIIERLEGRIDALEKEVDSYLPSDERYDSDGDISDGYSRNSVDSSARLIEVEATFYTAQCEGCIGITKTGYDVRETIYTSEGLRIIAVDPSVIPLGSIVRVKLEDGTEFKAQALDIGSAIKGARIDVLVSTRKEAYRLGRQAAEIEIIKEGDR